MSVCRIPAAQLLLKSDRSVFHSKLMMLFLVVVAIMLFQSFQGGVTEGIGVLGIRE